MTTIAVTDQTFDTEVRESNLPVVVDFWAEWCGPCKQIGPILEELSNEMGNQIKVVTIDADANPDTANKVGIRGLPSLFVFKGGSIVSNRSGAAPKAPL